MRKLALSMAMSLDGLIARPGRFGARRVGTARGGSRAHGAQARLDERALHIYRPKAAAP